MAATKAAMAYDAEGYASFVSECKKAVFQPGVTVTKIQHWQEGARRGDLDAMHHYGIVLIAKDRMQEGIQLIEDSATGGSAKAAYNAGRAYMYGIGVRKNIRTSTDYFRLACENGMPEAIPIAAFMLVRANRPGAAFRLLRHFSSGHGNVAAQAKYQIGMCYINGLGTKPDKRLGTSYIIRSALMNNADAQFALSSFMLEERKPRVRDAALWRLKAAMNGHHDALESVRPLLGAAARKIEKASRKSLLNKPYIH